MATENEATPSSLSLQNQRGTDRLQNNKIEDTIKQLKDRGCIVTEEYSNTGQLAKVCGEHPQRKTLWDWLQLLIVPLLIALLGIGFTLGQNWTSFKIAEANREQDLKIANDTQEEATLKAYLDDMTKLRFVRKLGSQAPADKVISAQAATNARSKTLTVLRRLTDPQRKAIVVQFLYESNLIGYYDSTHRSLQLPIIDLRGADLTKADLAAANLFGANLPGANLRAANLSGANLSCASLSSSKAPCGNLHDADLGGADLSSANLVGTTLNSAKLSTANLSNADLSCTNLSDGQNSCTFLSNADLSNANLNGANLHGAYLNGTDLYMARLNGANLEGAHLDGAKGLTQQQLDQVYSCKTASLSSGLTCHKQH